MAQQPSNPLNPLQQTVFEEGPRSTFTPPEVQNVYQEGQTIFANQPVQVQSADVDWYTLGENAFAVAQRTFTNVLDYFIESKGNAVAELSNKYQEKVAAEYDKLQRAQALAKANKEPAAMQNYNAMVLEDMKKFKDDWNTEVNLALESNVGNAFQPAINYLDENLDVKTLGLKYQRLAVAARRADRDVVNMIRKTEWDILSTGLTEEGKRIDFTAVRMGTAAPDPKVVYSNSWSGALPISTPEGELPKIDNVRAFGLDENGNVLTNDRGMPVLNQDNNGFYSINPTVGIDWARTTQEVDTYVQLGQYNPYGETMLFNERGLLMPDTADQIKFIMKQPQTTRSAQEKYMVGKIFASLPPGAVTSNVKSMGLSQEEGDMITLYTEAVRYGAGFDTIQKLSGLQPKAVSESINFVESFRGDELISQKGLVPSGTYGAELDQQVVNTALLTVAASVLGYEGEDVDTFIEQYSVDAKNVQRDVYALFDESPTENLSTLLNQNPEVYGAFLYASAMVRANLPALMEGQEFDEDKLKEFSQNIVMHQMSRGGVISLTEDGQDYVVKNPGFSYLHGFIGSGRADKQKKQDELAVTMASMPETMTSIRMESSNMPLQDRVVATATSMVRDTDIATFNALSSQLVAVVPNRNGQNSKSVIGPDMVIKLAIASSPGAWRLERFGGPLAEDASLEEKLQRAKLVLESLDDASKFGFKLAPSPSQASYMRAENGGIPIGLTSIPLKDGTSIRLEEIFTEDQIQRTATGAMVTPLLADGTPALSVPAYTPKSTNEILFADKISNARIAALNGATSRRYTFADKAPAGTLRDDTFFIDNATFAQGETVSRYFRFANDIPITTTQNAIDELRKNGDTLINLASDTPELADIVPVLREEFGLGGNRKIFSDGNMTRMIEQAKAKGAKTLADVYAYALNVVKSRHDNLEETRPWDSNFAKYVAQPTSNIPINEGDFVVQAGEHVGRILHNQNSPYFYEGIKQATMQGYNVFRGPMGGLYISKDTMKDANGKPYILEFAGRGQKEETADFAARFNKTWGKAIEQQRLKPQVLETLSPLVSQDYLIQYNQRNDTTVLPSKMREQFDADFTAFKKKFNLDSPTTDPKTAMLAERYDWAGYWMQNRRFPDSMENLPKEYALTPKEIPIKEQNTIKKIRETSDVQLSQPILNRAISTWVDPNSEAAKELTPFARTTLDKLRSAGWTPSVFEYQVRLLAKQKNVGANTEFALTELKPDQIMLGDEVAVQIKKDIDKLEKLSGRKINTDKINEVLGNKNTPQYNTFKINYLMEMLSPSGRKLDESISDPRLKILAEFLSAN